MCGRPPGDTVARAQRGDAFISRRATRSNRSDEKRRDLRSIVTFLVWHRRRPNASRPRMKAMAGSTGQVWQQLLPTLKLSFRRTCDRPLSQYWRIAEQPEVRWG